MMTALSVQSERIFPHFSPSAELDAAREARELDLALAHRVQRGDTRAFRELVRRHQDKVYRLAFRFTREETLAQDVVQDAFLQVFRKIDQFQEQSAFATWLHRVTVNAALMRMRVRRRSRELSFEDVSPRFTDHGEIAEPIDDWSSALDDRVARNQLSLYAAKAVDALPEGYKSVFILREIEELSTEEVAEVLQLSVPTVKTRLHRARLALRKVLARKIKDRDLELAP